MTSGLKNSRRRYRPPFSTKRVRLSSALEGTGRFIGRQLDLLNKPQLPNDVLLYYAGNISLLHGPCVAVVGARNVSAVGKQRTRRLARDLVGHGVAVVSGLASGVDTAALRAAIESGGSVVAVIGTPIDRAYPEQNIPLQEEIYRRHLLISQFPIGGRVHRSNFPLRNKLMAVISDATVVMEASDTSGTLHQAAECSKLGRWLFIDKPVMDNSDLTWPARFSKNTTTVVMESSDDIKQIYREQQSSCSM